MCQKTKVFVLDKFLWVKNIFRYQDPGTARHGNIWHGTDHEGTARKYLARHGSTRSWHGTARDVPGYRARRISLLEISMQCLCCGNMLGSVLDQFYGKYFDNRLHDKVYDKINDKSYDTFYEKFPINLIINSTLKMMVHLGYIL